MRQTGWDGTAEVIGIARRIFLVQLMVAVLLALAGAGAAAAQTQAAGTVLAAQQPVVAGLVKKAADVQSVVPSAVHDDARLTDLRLQLEQVVGDLQKSRTALQARIQDIDDRLGQLGPPPAAGAPAEPEAVTSERNALQDEKAQINALIGQADTAASAANRTTDQISEMRRDLFTRTLSRRYAIDYSLATEAASELKDEVTDLSNTIASWLTFVIQFKLRSVIVATLFALIAAVVLLYGGRRLVGNLIEPDPARTDASYLTRLSVAFWSTLLPSLAVSVFLFATWYFYDYFAVLRPDINAMTVTLFNVIAIVFFISRLAHAVFSPGLPHWRLLKVESRPARTLVWLIVVMTAVTGIDFVLSRVNQVLHSPLTLTVAKSLIATVLVGILIILAGLVRPFADEEGQPKKWPRPFRYFLYLLGAVTIIAALLGYIGFARFVSQQIVITGAVLLTMYIGFLTAHAIGKEGAFPGTVVGRSLQERFKLDDTTLDQLGVVIDVLITVLIVGCGIPLILLQWGFQWADIRSWTVRMISEVRIGSVSFSLIGIASGIAVFVIGYFITRWFQSWVDGSVMARARMDSGVRNSVRAAIGYAGVAIAALIGISAAGINLSSLALVAGALSLGIGFGLQNIVSNFVSGLILLAERPFKAGDWIVSGDVSGIVRKISVRATEIETFQRQTVILPNSNLINSAVGNWTHRNRLGRIEIAVPIAYGADVRKVQSLLLEVARAQPAILKNPEPFVAFAGFSDTALNFEIRVFLADILASGATQNELRFAVVEALAGAGIGLAYREGAADRKTHTEAEAAAAGANAGLPVEAETPAPAEVRPSAAARPPRGAKTVATRANRR